MSVDLERGEWGKETLPASWCWVDFDIFWTDHTDAKRKLPQKLNVKDGTLAVVDQGIDLIGGYTNDVSKQSLAPLPAIIFGDHTRIAKFIDRPFVQGADGVRVLCAGQGIEPTFAYHALRCVKLPDKGYSRHFKFLKATLFPLAPLAEQRRIVAKIDSLSTKSKRAREQLDRVPRLVEKYKQAILAAAYSGSLTRSIPGSPPTTSIGNMIIGLDQGWSPKCEREPAADPLDWGVIKTTAIQAVIFIPSENKKLPSRLAPRPDIVIEVGDILITRAGPRSRVAISCLVRQTRPRLMLCDKAYRLRVRPTVADPAFLTYMLNAPQSLEILERMKTGISDSGLNLTQSKFLDLSIPKFSLADQREIVRHIEGAFGWIDRLASEANSARKLIDHLDKAILAKVFKGELVPQDPSDEPANELLERIRAERKPTHG
jgi:hypothetical protein